MHRLPHFLQSQWEQIVWTVVWIPLVLTALVAGDITFFILSFIGGGISLIALYSLIDKIRKRRQPSFGGEASGIHRIGLIFTVGLQGDTITYVLRGQNPQWVGFLCTEQTLNVVETLVRDRGLKPDHWRREIVDPRDIDDIRTKTDLIFYWMLQKGLKTEKVALDPTGGMTPMSLGAYSVAQERQIDSQYVRSEYDEQNRPIPGSQELVFLSRYTPGS
ncbi:MAG: hypothetical protein ACREA0_00610 [bacterium]